MKNTEYRSQEPEVKTQTHFIGFGNSGRNALKHIHSKGVDATYLCIVSPDLITLLSDIKFIPFDSPTDEQLWRRDWWYNDKIILTDEIKNLFQENVRFIILADLGRYQETMLIKTLFPYLIKNKKNFTIICRYPFNFEGPNPCAYAVELIRRYIHTKHFLCFKSDDLPEICGSMLVKDTMIKAWEHYYKIYTTWIELPYWVKASNYPIS